MKVVKFILNWGNDLARERMVALDGLRGTAALAVVAYHCGIELGLRGALTVKAQLSVDFFFCLSGFVLAYAHDEALRSGALKTWVFFVKRYQRFFPVTLISSTIAILVYLYIGRIAAVDAPLAFILSVLVLPGIDRAGAAFLVGTFWSLFSELVANAAYAFVAAHAAFKAVRWVFAISLLGLCIVICYFGSVHVLFAEWHTWIPSLFRTFSSFFAGLVVFRLWQNGVRLPKIRFAYLVGVLLFPMLLPGSIPLIQVPLQITYVAIIFPCLVLAGASATSKHVRLLAGLGDASFIMYGIHLPILKLVVHFYNPTTTIDRLVMVVVFTLAMEIVALALATYYEIPLLKLMRRKKPMVSAMTRT